jgi:hypothetical protein
MNFKLLAVAALAAAYAGASAQDIIWNASPANGYWGGSNAAGTVAANINSQGEVFGLSYSNPTITGFGLDLLVAAGAATGTTNFTNLQLMVTFFTGWQSTFTGSGNEFSSPVYTVTYTFGAESLANNTVYGLLGTPAAPEFVLPTALAVTGNKIGIQFTWLDNGAATNFAQTAWSIGATAPSVGTNAFQYPNLAWGASGGTSSATSIAQANYWYGGTNAADVNLGAEIYATPEPCSMAILGLGAVGLLARRRRKSA